MFCDICERLLCRAGGSWWFIREHEFRGERRGRWDFGWCFDGRWSGFGLHCLVSWREFEGRLYFGDRGWTSNPTMTPGNARGNEACVCPDFRLYGGTGTNEILRIGKQSNLENIFIGWQTR